jgi:hypothetical protein
VPGGSGAERAVTVQLGHSQLTVTVSSGTPSTGIPSLAGIYGRVT